MVYPLCHGVVMRENYARLRNLKISCRKSTKFIYDTLVEKNSLLYKKLHELFLGALMQFQERSALGYLRVGVHRCLLL